ncbi:hypothetical protein PFISCL1PPCAC_25042, partial [Pristionchus fissidentatus]
PHPLHRQRHCHNHPSLERLLEMPSQPPNHLKTSDGTMVHSSRSLASSLGHILVGSGSAGFS